MALLFCTAFAPKSVSAQVINDICIATSDGVIIIEADKPITWGAKLENILVADDQNNWVYSDYKKELVYNEANNKNYYVIYTGHSYGDNALFCVQYFNGIENGKQVDKYLPHDFIFKGGMAFDGPLFTPNWNGKSYNFSFPTQDFSFVRK